MQEDNPKQVICQLLREFYQKGWCSGSGGGISIRESDDSIYVAPSGVLKEYVQEDEIYKINIEGEVVENPTSSKQLKPSECSPLFNEMYKQRRSGAALHSHSLNACLITRLYDTEVHAIDFEMIKGIKGHKNSEFCVIPLIENTENECQLTERLSSALISYPRTQGILVRNHGLYVFGETWQKAKIAAECYDYIFKAILELKKFGISCKQTISCDPKLRIWYVDEDQMKLDEKEGKLDIRQAYQYRQYQWLTPEYLKKLGIIYWKLDGQEDNQTLQKIRNERGYKNYDIIEISEKKSKNYKQMLETFKQEHIHYDEEIRYIIDGSGYFDIRSHEDKWIRIHVTRGDMIVLPEGMYHRFTTDACNYIKAMRLFQDEPKWTPYNRPDDESVSRKKYLQYIQTQF
ncbi:RmlC-like cupin domain [Pseudocohnilembus persalinus]|uniref:Acireductone dioxygenase n=1 Tax=Pseudocohnilembus persalinus TaxID=266149 RepID=A0A0V0QS86_PSEPJ|nr:RmlC-like cupin domain [Pseudocohnilembus persalinus]|eukprot:KRX05187.1 RmlC-like cupin domain [Pseudocohnilembus persalinus]